MEDRKLKTKKEKWKGKTEGIIKNDLLFLPSPFRLLFPFF